MKRWEDVLLEPPSNAATNAVEKAVLLELAEMRTEQRRGWLAGFAWSALGLAGVWIGFRLSRGPSPGEPNTDMAMLADLMNEAEDDLDLELAEDLDVLEILEELEAWQNS